MLQGTSGTEDMYPRGSDYQRVNLHRHVRDIDAEMEEQHFDNTVMSC